MICLNFFFFLVVCSDLFDILFRLQISEEQTLNKNYSSFSQIHLLVISVFDHLMEIVGLD